MKNLEVAIVHDYLNAYGGAESVVDAIWELFPKAPIYTALWDKKAFSGTGAFEGADIRTPKWAKMPFVEKFYKYLVPLYPLFFENLDLSGFGLIISSSANFAKGVRTSKNQVHISYIHTPPRFLYGYPTETGKRDLWYCKIPLKILDFFLRRWDFKAAQRPNYLICNSVEVKNRIKKFYGRDAVIVPPFLSIDPKYEKTAPKKGDYYLALGRLSLFKNFDKIIPACAKVGRSLKVAGVGREFDNLRKLAKSLRGDTEMLGFVSEEEKVSLYKGCRAFINIASDEDFGMTPLEAMHFGKPCILLRSGGFLDYAEDGYNSILIDSPLAESLEAGIKRFESLESKVNWAKNCKETAAGYTKERFQTEFMEIVRDKLGSRLEGRG